MTEMHWLTDESMERKYAFSYLYAIDKRAYYREYLRYWRALQSDEYKRIISKCSKDYQQEHRLEYNAWRREYRKRKPVLNREIEKRRYQKHKEKRKQFIYAYMGKNKVAMARKARLMKAKRKERVLTYYGNGVCACTRCGFVDIRALTIDHINNNGNVQRKKTGCHGGEKMYRWLENNNFPKGYQTLCMNCQWIKRAEHLITQHLAGGMN